MMGRIKKLCLALGTLALGLASVPVIADKTLRPSAFDYKPVDDDERSLWLEMDEQERNVRNSPFLVTDPELNAYVRSVLCKTVGDDRCKATRIYIVRTAHFNAAMAPNGMMVVWTGLLVRTRNEAELATVLGHEFAHFDNQHSLQAYRDLRAKTDAMTWLTFVPGGMIAQLGLFGSVIRFNRDMERQADMQALRYLAESGYDTRAASQIWEQLRAEMASTEKGRAIKRMEDVHGNFFASHPSSKQRMDYLREAAANMGSKGDYLGEERYRKALASWWPQLIDDQIKLADFTVTEFLLESIAHERWTAGLHYARGELYRTRAKNDDFAKAIGFYRNAIAADPAFAASWRGLGLALLRNGEMAAGKKALREYLKREPNASDHLILAEMAGMQ
jgi:beta-barrel assembly-enhancing protease